MVHAKDVNRNGVLSFYCNCFSFVQIFREWMFLQSIVSGSVFGTPYAPVQCWGSGDSTNQPFHVNQDPGFWRPKIFKNLQRKKNVSLFLIKDCNLLFLGRQKGRPSYKRSLQPSKENIQHFKTWNFLTLFKFCRSLCPTGSGSGFRIRIRIHWPGSIRIRIRNSASIH